MKEILIPAELETYIQNPTNNRLPDETETAARQLLADVTKRLELIDATSPDRHRDPVVRPQRASLARLLQSLSIILAPQKRLPQEILAKVFWHCADETYIKIPISSPCSCHKCEHFGIFSPPWSFSHVCSSWRNTALNAPSLWTRIRIQEPAEHHKEIYEDVLSRSGRLPLDLDINALHTFGLVYPVVLPHASRISRLTLRGSVQDLSLFLSAFSKPRGLLHSLEEIHLVSDARNLKGPNSVLYYILPDDATESMDIFNHCSQLKKFTLRDSNFTAGLMNPHLRLCPKDQLNLPFFQLTYLKVTIKLEQTEAVRMLSQTLNLVECDLTILDDQHSDSISPSLNITLPHLTHLRLCTSARLITHALFKALILPSVTQLGFALSAVEPPPDNLITPFVTSELVSLIARSSYRITHLQFRHREELEPILEHLRDSLELLHAPLSIFRKDTMQRITRGELVLPVLKKLVCCVCFEHFGALTSMVTTICASRRAETDNLGSGLPLELEVCVLTSYEQEQQHSEAVEAMKREVPDSCMITTTCREPRHHW